MEEPRGDVPPIDAQSIIDLVFTATAFSSSDERARKLGELLFIDFLQAVRQRHAADKTASAYLDAIVPTVGSALRAFAVEKLNYKRDVLPLEELLKYESTNITQSTVLPLQAVGATFSKWATRTATASLAAAGGLGSVALFQPQSQWAIGALLLACGTVAAIAAECIARWYRQWRTKRVINAITPNLNERWGAMYLRYEAILVDCLLQVIRAQETWYPHIATFTDGHLFPRAELPIFPPPNARALSPSPRPAVELLRDLRGIATARMSIRPGLDKLGELESKLTVPSVHAAAAPRAIAGRPIST
jgi:hypothetical protein